MIDWTATQSTPETTRVIDKVTVICEKCKKSRQITYNNAKRTAEHVCMSCRKKKGKYTTGQIVTHTCIDCQKQQDQEYRPDRYDGWRCHHCSMVHGHEEGKFTINQIEMTDEVRAKIGNKAKKQWQDPEYRRKWKESRDQTRDQRSATSKVVWSDQDRLRKLSESIKSVWCRPDYREIKSKQSQELWEDDDYIAKQAAGMDHPEVRQKISDTSKRLWAEQRQMMVEAITLALSDPDVRSRLSEASKAAWLDPEYRERVITGLAATWTDEKRSGMSIIITEILANPIIRQKISEASKATWLDPEYRQRVITSLIAVWTDEKRSDMSVVITEILADPVIRQKISEATKAAWLDPEYRQRISEATKAAWLDPEYRQKISEADRAAWLDPEYRQKVSEASRAAWLDPEYRQKVSEAIKAAWLDPEYRQKIATARANQPRISNIQEMLYTYLDDLGVEYRREGADTIIGYYAFDCLIPSTVSGKKLLIECQGDYWHSLESAVNNDRSKFTYIDRYFPDHEIMYLWEHEFYTEGRVLDRLKLKIGLKIETADFNFDDVTLGTPSTKELRSFLDAYHYIGKDRGGLAIGAYIDSQLIGCVVFSPPLRQNTAGQFGMADGQVRELSRLCIHPSYHKKNFASWIVSRSLRSLKANKPTIKMVIAYSDRTLGHSGTVYRAANFTEHHRVEPDYWYVDTDGFVMHKRTLYGRAIKMSMTEAQFAGEYGYVKKYGGDKICFTMKLS